MKFSIHLNRHVFVMCCKIKISELKLNTDECLKLFSNLMNLSSAVDIKLICKFIQEALELR